MYNGSCNVSSRLEQAISELQGVHELLLTDDVEPRILEAFRDTLNRVRNTAWAAQQYVCRKAAEQEVHTVFSLLTGERIRAAVHLCQAISEDLKRKDVQVQFGNLLQLSEAMKFLTREVDKIIREHTETSRG